MNKLLIFFSLVFFFFFFNSIESKSKIGIEFFFEFVELKFHSMYLKLNSIKNQDFQFN